MDEKIRQTYTDILHNLLIEWRALEVNPNATQRDFNRVSSKIHETCDILDGLDKS